MSKKIFVLDTNVLLHDPKCFHRFEDNDVYVSIVVIEEMDNFKKDMNEIGRNARFVSRFLDSLRTNGRLDEGVSLGEGKGNVFVVLSRDSVDLGIDVGNKADNEILKVAYDLHKKKQKTQVIFVTKDTNLRIKASALGIVAEDYKNDKIELSDLYTGDSEVLVNGSVITDLYKTEEINLPEDMANIRPNQFVTLINNENPKNSALAKYNSTMKTLVLLKDFEPIWGISPRNKQQAFALSLLLDPEIQMVTLVGKAGTGKTLLAMAAGLQQVADMRLYKKMLIARPVIPMGKDLGYLPGDVGEKMRPWMQPLFDNLDFLISNVDEVDTPSYKELINQNILSVEPLTYIRGRSIPKQLIVIDEAQNLTPHEVKTIVTRAGEDTKIILTGDPYQIDNPYVDSNSNGLSYLVEKFKNEPISGHITLTKGERSPLAEIAAKIL